MNEKPEINVHQLKDITDFIKKDKPEVTIRKQLPFTFDGEPVHAFKTKSKNVLYVSKELFDELKKLKLIKNEKKNKT